MSTWMLFVLAIGLSMDAFAVSISDGMCYKGMKKTQAVSIALAFGLFQGLMPLLGYLAGSTFSSAVQNIDHWFALILLGFIGGKMVVEAVRELRCPEQAQENCKEFSYRLLLVQAVATSIDALAVGVSFALMNVNIWTASSFIIGFFVLYIGVFMGNLGLLLKEGGNIRRAYPDCLGIKIL
ncbi:MAG: manganese efflux pump MntP family protein [Oscillospiraceae bacterium]